MSHVGSTTYRKIMEDVGMLHDAVLSGSDQSFEDLNQIHLRLTIIIDKLLKLKTNE